MATYLQTELLTKLFNQFTVTVIPHRPERPARLEKFLSQLADKFSGHKSVESGTLLFEPDILHYKPGVKSHSGEHLSQHDRFINVRDHLAVTNPGHIEEKRTYVVIDDVATTGSTLIYAKKYLAHAGAGTVICIALAMNISDVVPKS